MHLKKVEQSINQDCLVSVCLQRPVWHADDEIIELQQSRCKRRTHSSLTFERIRSLTNHEMPIEGVRKFQKSKIAGMASRVQSMQESEATTVPCDVRFDAVLPRSDRLFTERFCWILTKKISSIQLSHYWLSRWAGALTVSWNSDGELEHALEFAYYFRRKILHYFLNWN